MKPYISKKKKDKRTPIKESSVRGLITTMEGEWVQRIL